MNASTKVSLGQKRWLSAGANTLLMASMLFFVQVSSSGGEISEAYVPVHKTSYLSNPEFEEKRLTSTVVNPELMEFIADLEDPSIKKGDKASGTESDDMRHFLKELEDLEMRVFLHYADPHFDPGASKKRMVKLRNQLQDIRSDLDADQLFKNPVHNTK